MIRTPVIPGFNDTVEEISLIVKFISTRLPGASGLELLPYHKLGRGKYASIGLQYRLEDLEPPKLEKMKELERVVDQYEVAAISF